MNGRLLATMEALEERTPWWFDPVYASEERPIPLGFSLRTKRGLGVIDRVASLRPMWQTSGDLGSLSLLVLGAIGMVLFGLVINASFRAEAPTKMHDPGNWLAIPGVNEFIPVVATGFLLVSLIVSMFVHEFGHAVAARAHDIPVEEWGIFFLGGILPWAAYVQSDYDAVKDADTRVQLRFYSAGVLNNLVVGMLAGAVFGFLTDPGALTGLEGLAGREYVLALTATLTIPQNIAVWLFLMNLNLAIFNALPLSILDGGHVLRALLERVADGTGHESPDVLAKRISKSLSYGFGAVFAAGMVMPYV